MTHRGSCILVELTTGPVYGFDYPDEETAEGWYQECRNEWNEGRNVVFYWRSRHGTATAIHDADDVAHLEVTTREDAEGRGAVCVTAVTYG